MQLPIACTGAWGASALLGIGGRRTQARRRWTDGMVRQWQENGRGAVSESLAEIARTSSRVAGSNVGNDRRQARSCSRRTRRETAAQETARGGEGRGRAGAERSSAEGSQGGDAERREPTGADYKYSK